MISLAPITMKGANVVVSAWHSHHKPVRGCVFCIGAWDSGSLAGVVIVGRPVARALQDGRTFEVTRLCTNGHRNAASRLLGAAWRAARAMGVTRMVSYTRSDELGTCYRAAGWTPAASVRPEAWDHGNKSDRWLPGLYAPTTELVARVRWEIASR